MASIPGASGWFRRLVQSLEFSAGFELFFLLGPGELARPALSGLAAALARFGEPRWHPLHREGFERLIAGPDRGTLHLVHGLERMPPQAASELMARLNLNRDRLRELDAPVLFWVPQDAYEEVLHQAPDLIAWRSQVDVVSVDDFMVSAQTLQSERASMRAAVESAVETPWDPRRQPADVAILVVLAEEFRMLVEHAGRVDRLWDQEAGREVHFFEVPARDGGTYRCVTTFVEQMGHDAAVRALESLGRWNPATLVSLGLASSLHGEVARVGDVLVVRTIVEHGGARARTVEVVSAQASSGSLDEQIVRRIQHLERSMPSLLERWRREAASVLGRLGAASREVGRLWQEHSIREAPIILGGTLEVSTTVLGTGRSGPGSPPQAVAVELEGVSAHLGRHLGLSLLVLRGIGDVVGEDKPDPATSRLLREYATGNVVRLLFGLLRDHLLPRSRETSRSRVPMAIPVDAPVTGSEPDPGAGSGDASEEPLELSHLVYIRDRAVSSAALADARIEQGELHQALQILREELLPRYAQLGDLRSWAATHEKIAGILVTLGRSEEALRVYRDHALPARERLGEPRAWAVTVGRIADLLTARGEYDAALTFRREQELPAYERMGDPRACAVTVGKIADLLSRRGEVDQALRIHREQELSLYEQLGDAHAYAVTMGKIADLLAQRGQVQEALKIHVEQELPVYERLGDTRRQALTREKLAALSESWPGHDPEGIVTETIGEPGSDEPGG